MVNIVIILIIVTVLVFILLLANLLLASNRPNYEKLTAYECGYSSIHGQTRMPFNVQYYLVGILFLIFDLEILLLYPLIVILNDVSYYGVWIGLLFLIILTLGFVYEFGSGALNFTDQRSSIKLTVPFAGSSSR